MIIFGQVVNITWFIRLPGVSLKIKLGKAQGEPALLGGGREMY